MDRRRGLATLVRLSAIQHLQFAEARIALAAAIEERDRAHGRTQDSVHERARCETAFDGLLGSPSFDPETARRAGCAIMIAEDQLTECQAAEAYAERGEQEARTGWHRQRLQSEAVARQRRVAERKAAQISEDKASVDAIALAASRRGAG